MGSFIEINDTLQLSSEQGFPEELNIENHLQSPYSLDDFKGKTFTFFGKPSLRVYHAPPVRTFLVENREDKWIYWGLAHIIKIEHDYINKTTSGEFRLINIYTPEEMKQAFHLMDRRPELNYFSS